MNANFINNQTVNESIASPNKLKMSLHSGYKSKIGYKHIKDTIIQPESDDDSELDALD